MDSDYKIKALLCYAVFPISSLIIFITEINGNRQLKYHALQGIITGLALIIVFAIVDKLLGWIPLVGWLIGLIMKLAIAALWIMCMVRAYRGEMFKIPFAGDLAERVVG